jgi:outer membrane lipoprotein SlyB
VIGAITGGRKGAAIGSAIGAGGGTAVVLATEGKEIRLAPGRKLKVSLNNPLTIRTT